MQRKISAGCLPEVAAIEAGIPWDEAKTWLEGARPAHVYDDDGLRALAARAMTKAVKTLERLADDQVGRVSSSSVGPGMVESTAYDDLAAAKALLDGAIKLRRMLQGKKIAEAVAPGKDLFDRPKPVSPWTFRKPD